MARWNYFNRGDHYSEWHRKFEGIAMIDVDSVECCQVCYEPLAIIEVAMDKGQNKAYTLVKKIADKMQLPGFVVLYTAEQDEITQFRIKRVSPQVSKTYRIAEPELWLSYLKSLQDSCKSCSIDNIEW
jgi:hypothetical protein